MQLLDNVQIDPDLEKGVAYFKGCTKFMDSLEEVLDMLTTAIFELGESEIYYSNLAQLWGISILIIILIISPMLVVLSKNAISTIQMFAVSVENKAVDMKRQLKKRDRMIYRMLPKVVVIIGNSGLHSFTIVRINNFCKIFLRSWWIG